LARAGKHLSWQLVVAISIGTLRGLGAAHERRTADGEPAPVIHRDVSPQNILVGASGVVKLTDFGLSRARDRANSLTVPGTVKGKLSYLAPEVTLGRPNSVASDLFSMGVVMWEVLCGQRLFDARNDLEIFKKIRACVVPPVRTLRPDVPEAVGAVVARATALAPKDRYANAAEMIAELQRAVAPAAAEAPELIGRAVAEARQLITEARQRAMGARSAVVDGRPPSDASPPGAAAAGAGGLDLSEPSVSIEISTADLSVEPLPLDKPKR
jgi:serine/threonine-protein kinase